MLTTQCGMLIIFNPLKQAIVNQSLDINLYYTGNKNSIYITNPPNQDDKFDKITLYDQYYYTLYINMPPMNISYWVFNCNT